MRVRVGLRLTEQTLAIMVSHLSNSVGILVYHVNGSERIKSIASNMVVGASNLDIVIPSAPLQIHQDHYQ